MNNLPLQPLVWDWTNAKDKDTNAICRAKSPSHEYIVRMNAGSDVYVDYYKFDNSEGENNRKDEPPVFSSVGAAQDWAQSTHYTSKMQPYVKTSPTWIDVNERLPDRSGRYMVVHQTIKPVRSKSTPVDIDTYDENEKAWTFFRSGIMQEVTHWMPIPEFKESDCD